MPITVRHGEDNLGALAALALLAGIGQQRAPEAPRLQIAGGDFGAGGAPRPTPVSGIETDRGLGGMGLSYSPTPQRWDQVGMSQKALDMQAEAKAEAEGWEQKYTAKQRAEAAQWEAADKQVQADPSFSAAEKAAYHNIKVQRMLGMERTTMPPDPNKPKFPPGQGPGDVWVDKDTGALVKMDKDGTPGVLVRPDQIAKSLESPEVKQQQAMLEHQQKLELEKMKIRAGFASKPIKEIDSRGNAVTRFPTPDEVNGMMKSAFPDEEQAVQQAGQGAQPQSEPWWKVARQKGYRVTKSDLDLPEQVGKAQAAMRTLRDKFGSVDKIPQSRRSEWNEAVRVYKQYLSLVSENASGF